MKRSLSRNFVSGSVTPDLQTAHVVRAGSRASRDTVAQTDRRRRASGVPAVAEALRDVLGEIVDVSWGIGSQQVVTTTTGTLASLDDRSLTLTYAGEHRCLSVVIPWRFFVRFCQ